MKLAILFSGQGSQHFDMLANYDRHQGIFLENLGILRGEFGLNLPALLESKSELLHTTEVTQLAVVAHSLSMINYLKNELANHEIIYVGGHSLGQLTASSYSLDLQASVALAAANERALLMKAALSSFENYIMVAVLGLDCSLVEEVLALYSDCYLVNDNCPLQQIIAIPADRLPALENAFKSHKVRKIHVLNMSVISHCELLNSAVAPFQNFLHKNFTNPKLINLRYCVASNVTARLHSTQAELIDQLAYSLCSRVRFSEMISNNSSSIDCFIEIGPSKVLQGLLKKICPNRECLSTENSVSLEVLKNKLLTE